MTPWVPYSALTLFVAMENSEERECLRFSSQQGGLSHTGETEQMVFFFLLLYFYILNFVFRLLYFAFCILIVVFCILWMFEIFPPTRLLRRAVAFCFESLSFQMRRRFFPHRALSSARWARNISSSLCCRAGSAFYWGCILLSWVPYNYMLFTRGRCAEISRVAR